ncbi:hypothetical protein [Fusibacter bizertensis]
MLNIVLQDDLKAYLKAHDHKDISLSLTHSDYSTGNVLSMSPDIHYKAPDDMDRYDTYTVDDVRVYVEKDVVAYDDTLEFVEESLLGVHKCHVIGIKLDDKVNID